MDSGSEPSNLYCCHVIRVQSYLQSERRAGQPIAEPSVETPAGDRAIGPIRSTFSVVEKGEVGLQQFDYSSIVREVPLKVICPGVIAFRLNTFPIQFVEEIDVQISDAVSRLG